MLGVMDNVAPLPGRNEFPGRVPFDLVLGSKASCRVAYSAAAEHAAAQQNDYGNTIEYEEPRSRRGRVRSADAPDALCRFSNRVRLRRADRGFF